MTRAEIKTLKELLTKLRKERTDKYSKDGFDCSATDELYEYDDGDSLCEHVDGVLWCLRDQGKHLK